MIVSIQKPIIISVGIDDYADVVEAEIATWSHNPRTITVVGDCVPVGIVADVAAAAVGDVARRVGTPSEAGITRARRIRRKHHIHHLYQISFLH